MEISLSLFFHFGFPVKKVRRNFRFSGKNWRKHGHSAQQIYKRDSECQEEQDLGRDNGGRKRRRRDRKKNVNRDAEDNVD